ncbi:MAG: hypothetical protein U0694_14775 [Anaerolineae bacterium]
MGRAAGLGDGAMGTLLHSRGVPMDRSFDELNLTQPDLVVGVRVWITLTQVRSWLKPTPSARTA